jgi:hypothetical protein
MTNLKSFLLLTMFSIMSGVIYANKVALIRGCQRGQNGSVQIAKITLLKDIISYELKSSDFRYPAQFWSMIEKKAMENKNENIVILSWNTSTKKMFGNTCYYDLPLLSDLNSLNINKLAITEPDDFFIGKIMIVEETSANSVLNTSAG